MPTSRSRKQRSTRMDVQQQEQHDNQHTFDKIIAVQMAHDKHHSVTISKKGKKIILYDSEGNRKMTLDEQMFPGISTFYDTKDTISVIRKVRSRKQRS